MQVVVLAGGLGTRMRPMTERVPKALLEVCGRPFAAWQMEWLRDQGAHEVVFCIAHLGELIRGCVGDGSQWGLRVRYVDEGEDLRGTGGAVRLAVDRGALGDRFLLTYGDSYLRADLRKVWHRFVQGGDAALMTVIRSSPDLERPNASLSEGRIVSYRKGLADPERHGLEFIDYGLLGLTSSAVRQHIPAGERSELSELQTTLAERGEMAGYEVFERYFEIGSPAGLRALENHLKNEGRL